MRDVKVKQKPSRLQVVQSAHLASVSFSPTPAQVQHCWRGIPLLVVHLQNESSQRSVQSRGSEWVPHQKKVQREEVLHAPLSHPKDFSSVGRDGSQ